MHAGVTVELARETHAGPIAEMSRDHIEQGLGWRWTRQRVLRAIHHPETNVCVVTGSDGEVTGFGIMEYLERHAHLELLAVRPAHRRQGIASAIVRWLEDAARVAGAERIVVECRRSNDAARCLYLEHGYHERRIERAYYGPEDAIRLEKWLRARDDAA